MDRCLFRMLYRSLPIPLGVDVSNEASPAHFAESLPIFQCISKVEPSLIVPNSTFPPAEPELRNCQRLPL